MDETEDNTRKVDLVTGEVCVLAQSAIDAVNQMISDGDGNVATLCLIRASLQRIGFVAEVLGRENGGTGYVDLGEWALPYRMETKVNLA